MLSAAGQLPRMRGRDDCVRKLISLGASVILAAAGVAASAGSANASTPTACAATVGASVCWWSSTTTMQICDTRSDGDTPYAYILQVGGVWVQAFSDPYGSGGCVWAYPYQGTFDITPGNTITFYAANVNSSGGVVSSSPSVTAPW
jgi:hypothetical protein